MYKYIFHPSAVRDIENAIEWYESKSVEISALFKSKLENAFIDLKSNPFMCQKMHKQFRTFFLTHIIHKLS